jgi:hypothetical protein
MRARTIRVVFAAKLRKNLVLHAHSLLVDLASKLSPVPVPAQRRHALPSRRLPNFNAFVLAATSNLLAVFAPRHRVHPVFEMP